MSNYSIGLSGLQVAQQAIALIGTNIVNASTPGYHRQDLQIVPIDFGSADGIGGGARVTEVRRLMDVLLEGEIVRQHPLFGQADQELITLQSIEGSLGSIDAENLGTALTGFFNALQELAAQPTSRIYRTQAVWAADGMATHFNNLGNFLRELDTHLLREAQGLMAQANDLINEIAQLNTEIHALAVRAGNANILCDRRDQAIVELAELVDVHIKGRTDQPGVVDVTAWGTPLVIGGHATELEVGYADAGKIGVSVKDAGYFLTDLRGGRIGGLLALKNEIVAEIKGNLDALARQIITDINRYHAQGLGIAGAFSSLAGWGVSGDALEDWDADISAGTIYVRVTDLTTGQAQRHAVAVDPAVHTISDIATALDALAGLNASVADSALTIVADVGYEFDFLPALLPDPASSTLTGTATPTISGAYQGQENRTLTCTIVGTGEVGVENGLTVEVRNEAAQLVATLNVGLGYASGDRLDVVDGIFLAFTAGTLNNGETFTVEALADSDTSGLLAAAGMNAFFEGNSAIAMAVRQAVLARPELLATAVEAELSDNRNVTRMAQIGQTPSAALAGVTPSEYYRLLVTNLGENVRLRQARRDSLENVLGQLANQRDAVSGVDLNEEAARLLVFERMFQAAAKLIAVSDQALQFLFEII